MAHQRKRLPIDISPELDLDLRAFCEPYYDANRSTVVRRAISEFISRHTSDRKPEFDEIRRRIAGEPIRLVRDEDFSAEAGNE